MKPSFSKALITGASSGIGYELAHLCAQKNISLILSGRQLSILEKLQKKLSKTVDVEIIQADLTKRTERKKIIRLIHKKSPDLVINNAGLGFYGDAHRGSLEDQLLMLEVNAAAVLELTIEAVRALINASKQGVILNVSSVAGEHACPGMAIYGATKAFVTNFSKALDHEFTPLGVRVLASAPGQVETPFASRAARKKSINRIGPIMSAKKAAELIWHQIEKRKGFYIFDYRTRWLTRLAAFFPKKMVQRKIHHSIKQRIQ